VGLIKLKWIEILGVKICQAYLYIIYSMVTIVDYTTLYIFKWQRGLTRSELLIYSAWNLKKILSEKPDTKGHILYYFVHMKHLEKVNP